ncbi:hypothetical protein [Klebsiella pneumoniae]|uniref:T6SS effector phospholipase Tle3 domain-containing protein n=1 Tax=Klebsiella pneumoniae TaxID=573 RepID=UPI00217D667D|nr:hypothetical protein [Klebsiella pneumoniae]MCS6682263.1 hypothetical protein [Klebsiella pneumoniae subsp. pneumoniae]
MNSDSEPIRELECKFDDNWHPSWYSFPSHKNCQIRGDCDLPPHFPGIIILVHAVNSTGEWFSIAENKLCEGLNKRLGLNRVDYKLEPKKYLSDDKINSQPLVFRDLPEVDKISLQLFVFTGGIPHLNKGLTNGEVCRRFRGRDFARWQSHISLIQLRYIR